MKLAFGMVFGGTTQVRPPAGMASGQSIAIAPALVDGIATGGTWVPEGAVAAADLENGRYYANGAETTLEAMFVEDLVNWFPWDGSVGPGGLTDGQNPALAPAVAAGLVTGCTVVTTFDAVGEADAPTVVFADSGFLAEIDLVYGIGATRIAYDGNETTPAVAAAGVHKAAFTVSSTKLACSVDGAAVQTITAPGGGYDVDGIWFLSDGETKLKSIAFYSPQLDAALPALSAL